MNELQKAKIKQFLDDELMVEAVKEALLNIEESPVLDGEEDRIIGQRHRAITYAKRIVRDGFDALEQYKVDNQNTISKNEAR